MGQIASGMVVISAERRLNTKMMQPGDREWVIVIQAISSSGYSVPPYTKSRTTGSYRLLIVDGHKSHYTTDFEIYCKENNIVTLCMPAHSSHLLQPLDVGCFRPLKKAYGRQIEDKIRRGNTHITKEDFFPAFREAFTQALTEKNIQRGFRGAGLVPLGAESVISKLDVKLHTPTPPGSLPTTPPTWTSQTLNNLTEVSSQSELIKRRISRHQNSSLTSIIEAVEHLSKGAHGFMHQIALLRSENKILREENNLLSRRRRAKKTRLRQGGSLTIAEAEDLQSQREAIAQIEEETRWSSGRRPRTETG
ncbi:transposase [Colletotrichum chrysophilum]|uniref:Transposase n=1 Tax=Colletotrichum chrysophilum TaxID=1836956 RepID=A0AAD9A6J9_9PEZI|nr:transposase [Colletotrichum chrysophilum]